MTRTLTAATLALLLSTAPAAASDLLTAGTAEAARLGAQPAAPTPPPDRNRSGQLASAILLVGGAVMLIGAYADECGYGSDYCSSSGKLLLWGGTAAVAGGALGAVATTRGSQSPRPQLRYRVRF